MKGLGLVLGLAASLWVGSADAQCCGDCDGSGSVTINELIIAVNNALTDCGAPTPTQPPPSTPTPQPTVTRTPTNRCPRTLEDGDGTCAFRGRFNNGCGNQLDSVLFSNGTTVVVAIDTQLDSPPVVYFAANVVDDTHANLTEWSNDNFQNHRRIVSGELELTNNREDLVIFPNSSPFAILSCAFVRYQGDYLGSTGNQAARADGDDFLDALEGLQTWREQPPPEL